MQESITSSADTEVCPKKMPFRIYSTKFSERVNPWVKENYFFFPAKLILVKLSLENVPV